MPCWGFDFAPLSGLQTGQVASSCVSAVCNFGDLWCATISGPKTCVCMLFGTILILLNLSLCFASNRCSQVCTGLFANPMGCPHWGWTLFARQGGVGRISLLQIADPSCWFLTTGRQWNPPGNLHIAMLAWGYSVAKSSLHQECSPFKKQ